MCGLGVGDRESEACPLDPISCFRGCLFPLPFSYPCPASIYPHLFPLTAHECLCLALRVLPATVLGDADGNSSIQVCMVTQFIQFAPSVLDTHNVICKTRDYPQKNHLVDVYTTRLSNLLEPKTQFDEHLLENAHLLCWTMRRESHELQRPTPALPSAPRGPQFLHLKTGYPITYPEGEREG